VDSSSLVEEISNNGREASGWPFATYLSKNTRVPTSSRVGEWAMKMHTTQSFTSSVIVASTVVYSKQRSMMDLHYCGSCNIGATCSLT
jgi:hypothetical protein